MMRMLLRSDENVVEAAESDERRRIVMQAVKDLGEPDSTIIVQQYFYNRTAKDNRKTGSHDISSRTEAKQPCKTEAEGSAS